MPTLLRSETVIFTFPVDQTLGEEFVSISSSNPLLPSFLLDYYNRRCTVQLCAELFNFEAVLVALDQQLDPQPVMLNDVDFIDKLPPQPVLPRRVLSAVANPSGDIMRVVSRTADASMLYRSGQNQVFAVMGRRIDNRYDSLIRHVTAIFYLGELVNIPYQQPRYAQLARPT